MTRTGINDTPSLLIYIGNVELSKCSTSDYSVNADTDKDRFETFTVISFGYSGLGVFDRAVEIDT